MEEKERCCACGAEAAGAVTGTETAPAAETCACGCGIGMTGTEDVPAVPCGCHRKKVRGEKEYKDLMSRLNRVEGQIRGIRRMVEEGVYCPDIMVQVAAANAALASFNKVLLANHISTCVAEDIRNGRDGTVDELIETLNRLMR